MALRRKKSPEEIAENEEKKRVERLERAKEAFFRTPAGRARVAFENGDRLFQYQYGVMNQTAVIVAMVGSTTAKKTSDPTAVLNSVCHEGWDIVTGSFVFVEEGQQSRDKFMSSGQNVATKGQVIGYYLFRRCDENRRTPLAEPWNTAVALEGPSA